MDDNQIEQAFTEAQEKWAETHKGAFIESQQRYFFFAGSEFGLALAKETYNETHEIEGHPSRRKGNG